MDIISVALPFLSGFIAKYPVLAQVLAIVGSVLAAVPLLVNALVSAWLSLVNLLKAVALIPGCSSVQKLADALSVSYEKVHSWEESKLLPLLNRLSSLPLPKLPPKAPVPAGIEVKQ